MFLPDLEILTFTIPILSQFTTHQYTNSMQKTTNFAPIGCFLPKLAQNTPNLCKLGTILCDSTPPPRCAKICEKAPQKAGTPYQCETPQSRILW